jgi:hypothetical protein
MPPSLLGMEKFSAGVVLDSSAREPAIVFVSELGSLASRTIWTAWGFASDGPGR